MNGVIVESVGRLVPVNEQSSYGEASQGAELTNTVEKSVCFLTHSVNEELEEIKGVSYCVFI